MFLQKCPGKVRPPARKRRQKVREGHEATIIGEKIYLFADLNEKMFLTLQSLRFRN